MIYEMYRPLLFSFVSPLCEGVIHISLHLQYFFTIFLGYDIIKQILHHYYNNKTIEILSILEYTYDIQGKVIYHEN